MRGPYGFDMSDSCQNGKLKKAEFFCGLSLKALKDFDSIKSSSVYPEGAVLFLEKQDARGVFVLCEGEVKLTISSSEGKTLILRIAKPGEVLGLMATLSGEPYEVTAETLRPCQVAFVRRDEFLRFIAQHPEASLGIVKLLTAHYHAACEQLKTVGLSASAPEKLARLLLGWSVGGEETKLGTRITLPLTHQEIAEFIGSSRETVTRTLSDFRSRHLVTLKGSTLMIADRPALQACAND
ncbi:MAG: Crp/Fnr family transcriptional regulator [Candidatus Acidoferrales bacterium]|nr:Crp/Fnr family transcriptional regulator [Candidatus Acidoferrales bacterium]